MKIQCLIDRDGVTTVMYNGIRMDFEKNEHGDYVCDVCNPGSVDYLLKTFGGRFYREYVEPVMPTSPFVMPTSPLETMLFNAGDTSATEPVAEQTDRQSAKEFYQSLTEKEDVERYCLQDFGVNLSRRFSLENMKEQVFAIIDKEYE